MKYLHLWGDLMALLDAATARLIHDHMTWMQVVGFYRWAARARRITFDGKQQHGTSRWPQLHGMHGAVIPTPPLLPRKEPEMFTGTRTHMQDDDRITVIHNPDTAGRAYIIFESHDQFSESTITISDDRLAELRDKITAYLAAKQNDPATEVKGGVADGLPTFQR